MVEEYWAVSLPLKRSGKNINRFAKVSETTTKLCCQEHGKGCEPLANFPSKYKLCEWKKHGCFLPCPQTQYMLDT